MDVTTGSNNGTCATPSQKAELLYQGRKHIGNTAWEMSRAFSVACGGWESPYAQAASPRAPS